MQETEVTATQTPLAPPTVDTEVEAQPEAPLAPETAPEETEAPGPAPTEEETPEETFKFDPEGIYYKGEKLEDNYALVDHPEVKPFVEREIRRQQQTLQQQYEAATKETREGLEAIQENRHFANAIGNILQKMREEDLPGAEQMAERFNGMLQKREAYDKLLGQAGENKAASEIWEVMKSTLGRREQDALEDYATSRTRTREDLINHFVELRGASSKRPLQDKVTSLEAENESLKERIRKLQGSPDLEETTSAASGNPEQAWADAGFPESGPIHDRYVKWHDEQNI